MSQDDLPPNISPTAQFTIFPQLPRELQDLIWEAAIPPRHPRVLGVTARCYAHDSWLARRLGVRNIEHKTSLHLGFDVEIPLSDFQAAVTTLLRTCRRSRAVAKSSLTHEKTEEPVLIHNYDDYPDHIIQPTEGCRYQRTTVDGALDLFLLQPRGENFLYHCGNELKSLPGVRFVAMSMLRLLMPRSDVTITSENLRRVFPDLRVLYVYVSPAFLSYCTGRDGWPVTDEKLQDDNYHANLSRFLGQYGTAGDGPDAFVAGTGSGRMWVTVPEEEVRKVTRGQLAKIISRVGQQVAMDSDRLPPHVRIVTDLEYQDVEPVRRKPTRLHPPRFLLEATVAREAQRPTSEDVSTAKVHQQPRASHPFWETGAQDMRRDTLKSEEDDDEDGLENERHAPTRKQTRLVRLGVRIVREARGVRRMLVSCFHFTSKQEKE
jgi:hypothetical protein